MVSILSTYLYCYSLFLLILFLICRGNLEQNQVWAAWLKKQCIKLELLFFFNKTWVELLKQNKSNESMTIEMEKDLKRLETITERFSKIGSKTELMKKI